MNAITERLSAALADRYRIERELGQGGMATVYLAQDLRHDRKVAVKVLKPELAAVLGAERFVVEIKTTASLSHPHILPLFDSGTVEGFLYYVMPYIQGETVRDKLSRETQFGVDDSVRITREVADALDYAHRHGVIHRDIKPENLLLHDGRAMVMDFGIALAVSAAAGGRMTETGLSLGTPHYMSPEQATADKDLTPRSDIYSLGCVLYEMLAGHPPHTGATAQQVIMKIVTEEAAPVTRLRKSVAPNVAAAVAKALERLPADRFESAKAFADALSNPAFVTTSPGTLDRGPDRSRRRYGTWITAGIAAAALAVGGLAGKALGGRGKVTPEVARFPLSVPAGYSLYVDEFNGHPFALSPDGRVVAMVIIHDSATTRRQLYVRAVDQAEGSLLAGTEGATAPFFSPDGKSIGFFNSSPGVLKKVGLNGGPVVELAEAATNREAASWGDDGSIVFMNRARVLARVSGSGGTAVEIPHDSTWSYTWPHVLPGGKTVLAQRCRATCAQHELVAVDVASGRVSVVVPGGTRGWYLPGGILAYGTEDGTVFAVRFNPRTLTTSGEATPVLDGVEQTVLLGAHLDIASTAATMAYLPLASNASLRVVKVDRAGKEAATFEREGLFSNPRWSPDGSKILVQQRARGGSQIWFYDASAQTFSQLTREGNYIRPSWSPDGKRVAFFGGSNVVWMPVDRSQAPMPVIQGPHLTGGTATSWTRDDRWIVVDGFTPDGPRNMGEDIYVLPVGGKGPLEPVVSTAGNDQTGTVSPDGKWIAYISDESEQNKVYIRPFKAPGGQFLVSTAGARQPLWVSNSELAYLDNESRSLMVAQLQLGTAPTVLRRTRLFDVSSYRAGGVSQWDYDVSRDGKEFLFVKPARMTGKVEPIAILHWPLEIARRMREQGGR